MTEKGRVHYILCFILEDVEFWSFCVLLSNNGRNLLYKMKQNNHKYFYFAGNVIKSVFLIIIIICDMSSYSSTTLVKQCYDVLWNGEFSRQWLHEVSLQLTD